MRRLNCLHLATLGLALLAGSVEARSLNALAIGENEGQTTLVIKADGSCTWTNEVVQARQSLEREVTSWERHVKMGEDTRSEGGEAATSPPPATNLPQRSLTNEQLAAKLREMRQQLPDAGEDDSFKVENVDSPTNSVRLLSTRSFASLTELLSQSPYMWGPSFLMVADARFELDSNRNLRVTFSGSQGASHYAKTLSRGWRASKVKFEWRLVLPGKILSSGLPGTRDNTTWLSLDGEKPETVEAALKLMGSPLVITAESAGMKLDEPLESKKLVRAAGRPRGSGPDLPITDATPGFVAEPASLTLSTSHYFPEGEKRFKDRSEASMLGVNAAGTVVSARLFPPRGRQIRSVSGLRVKAARDDKGHPIAGVAAGDDNGERYSEGVPDDAARSEKGGAVRIELRMALPAPDAKAIEELEGEAVVLSVGGWRELVLTNVQPDAKKEIELGEILPGARLMIKKIGGIKPRKSVEATLEGPPAVNRLEVRIKSSGLRGGPSFMSDRRSVTSGNKTTRNVTIQSYEFETGDQGKDSPPTLVVRYPQDVKRERVPFKLTALDLF